MHSDLPQTLPDAAYRSALRSTIGPYTVDAVLGAGGMGIVYRAHNKDAQSFAVKTILPDVIDARALQRFMVEGTIRIAHPNVIRLLDTGQDIDGTPFIAFELLQGESLAEKLLDPRIQLAQLLDWATQTCEGLTAAHALGIVHRDLKPENLFCCEGGALKILDFGIARISTGPRMTGDGSVLGTLSYLSPEQARGSGKIDARTDVWALGAVLYEAVSGAPPFERPTAIATLVAIMQDDAVPLLRSVPACPSGLAEVIHRCLRRHPDERWQTAAELRGALLTLTDSSFEISAIDTARMTDPTLLDARSSIVPGESRVVVVMLARDVDDVSLVERAIQRAGGTAVPILGRDILGVFGGERWEGTEFQDAVGAALACRQSAERVGVGSGRALADEGSVAGEAVTAAERACGLALFGVAVDKPVAASVAHRFWVEEAEDGFHEVVGERQQSLSVRAPDEAEPLLGRELEVGLLEALLRDSRESSRATSAIVFGPAGIGKTRLVRHLIGQVSQGDLNHGVLVGETDPYAVDKRYGLFRSALLRRARQGAAQGDWPRIQEEAPPMERQRAVLSLVSEAVPDRAVAREHALFLGDLLGVPMPQSDSLRAARQDPGLMADKLRVLLLDYLVGLARETPLLLVTEDLHWADPASLELLAALPRLADRCAILHLGTTRPSDVVRSSLDPSATCLDLGGIKTEHARAWGSRILGRAVPVAFAEMLVERTEGNPLFLEQILRAMAERDDLDYDTGRIPLPVTVAAALQSRLDRLPSATKQVAKQAAVLAVPFAEGELSPFSGPGLTASLEELVRRRILARTEAAQGAPVYSFQSALMRDVTYGLIAPKPRVEMHASIARELAASGADLASLAHHLEYGGQPTEAAEAYARAVESPSVAFDANLVLRLARRALDIGPPQEALFGIHLAMASAYYFTRQHAEQGEALVQAVRLASDDAQRARSLTDRVAWLLREARLSEAQMVAESAVSCARRAGETDALVLALGRLSEVHAMACRFDASEAVLAEASRLGYAAPLTVRTKVVGWQAMLAAMRGDVGTARRAYAEWAKICSAVGDVRRSITGRINVADSCNRLGAYGEAADALRSAADDCRRVGNAAVETYAYLNLGYSLGRLGKGLEAHEALAHAQHLAAPIGDQRATLFARLYGLRIRMEEAHAAERVSELMAEGQALLGDLVDAGHPTIEILTRAQIARAHLLHGDLVAALEASECAFSMLIDLGAIEEDEAEVYWIRALVLEAAGLEGQAAAIRSQGRARLRELADHIQDADARERFMRDVPAHRALFGALREGLA